MCSSLRPLALAVPFALAVAVTGVHAQSTIRTGSLDPGDPTLADGEWFDEYRLDVLAGQEIVAILSSVEFDPYLIAIAPSGERFENDDHGDSADVSLVRTIAGETGSWRVQVTSYAADQGGEYALVLEARRRTDAETLDEELVVTGEIPAGRAASVSGTLDGSDPQRADGTWYEAWSIELEEGSGVLFLLTSPDFDAYLTLVSPTGRAFSDDDGAGGTDSRLEMAVDESGRWTVIANTLAAGESGDYTLSAQRR